MTSTRILGGLLLATTCLGACESQPPRQASPIPYTPGTLQGELRQYQLQNAQSGANAGVQNPAPTAVNPGVQGIERANTGGMGNLGAGAPTAVNPSTTGITRQEGVGAPMR
ncbi:MAG TPA: hypothetical protein VE684_17065 [Crenalkalicoccus sp.]|nr:hypothetical protein [Crenalkalicoccus sp.]